MPDADAAPRAIRTKIVATLGPAVAGRDALRNLLAAGVDVCRLNFSHGEQRDHADMLADVRAAAADLGRPVAVLGDLGGPKIRVGPVDEDNPDAGLRVETGGELTIQREKTLGRDGVVSCTYPGLVDDVTPGDRLLIEDGLLRFVCVRQTADAVTLRCTAGGVVKTRKGINLPNTQLKLPSITDRDWSFVDWAVENELDYLALSFVRGAGDIEQLRGRLDGEAREIGIIAKIEKAEALADIDRIVEAADGLMVARGDLGVEVDLARVPLIQKDLIDRCRRAGKPAIVATQMLQSMVDNPSPTRAEVSDVANAILDGTDACMLSGETSVGKFPAGSVHVMRHVAEETEKYLLDLDVSHDGPSFAADGPLAVTAAAARAVRRLAESIDVRLIAVYSHSGDTARIFAKQRFGVPVVALSGSPRRLRQMALHFGVRPLDCPRPGNLQSLVGDVERLAVDHGLAERGDRIVVVAGRSLGASGTMNGIVIHTVGHDEGDPCAP